MYDRPGGAVMNIVMQRWTMKNTVRGSMEALLMVATEAILQKWRTTMLRHPTEIFTLISKSLVSSNCVFCSLDNRMDR